MVKHYPDKLIIEIKSDEPLETQTAIRKSLCNVIKGEITDTDKQHLWALLKDVTPTKDILKGTFINLEFDAKETIQKGLVG